MSLTKLGVGSEQGEENILTSQKVLERVSEMQIGSRERFVMHADDPVFKDEDSVNLFILGLKFIRGHTTHCRWERVGNKILFEVSITS